MKTDPPFVPAEGAIHLHAKSPVHLDLAFIVNPRNPELNHPLRFDEALQNLAISISLVTIDDGPDGFEHFRYCLEKFRLIRIALSDNFQNFLHLAHKGVTSAGYLPRGQMKTSRAMRRSSPATCRRGDRFPLKSRLSVNARDKHMRDAGFEPATS